MSYEICPHCNGKLVQAQMWSRYDYNCIECFRGWKIQGEIWISGGSTNTEVYTKDEVDEIQKETKEKKNK